MSTNVLLEKYESLPENLKKQVESFINYLLYQEQTQKTAQFPEELEALVKRAENPDPKSIFGLARTHPLNLKEIRSKAWKR
ncbi:MAG: hypothetical protein AAFW00_24610 [Bacteroidota bacterium]